MHCLPLDSRKERLRWCIILHFFEIKLRNPGLPDGTFSNHSPNLVKFWRVLQWKLSYILYFMSNWYMYFTAIWHILPPWGIFSCYYLVYFFLFWYVVARIIWQPWRSLAATYQFTSNGCSAQMCTDTYLWKRGVLVAT
jgi:hypothetical protein